MNEVVRSLTGTASAPVLRCSRRYATSPDDVWSALTDPDRLRRWLGEVSGNPSDGFEITFAHAPDAPARAEIEECAPSRRLAVRWSWGRERASRVSVMQHPEHEGTLLTLEHRLGEPDHVTDYGTGWERSFTVLAQQLGAVAVDAPEESAIVSRWDALRRRAVELTLDLAAPPAEVWRAFATAKGLRRWWWTHWDDVDITADARAGGRYRIEAPAAGIILSGTYLTVDEPSHLSFTWRWGRYRRRLGRRSMRRAHRARRHGKPPHGAAHRSLGRRHPRRELPAGMGVHPRPAPASARGVSRRLVAPEARTRAFAHSEGMNGHRDVVAVDDHRHVRVVRLATAVGGRSGIEQPQPTRRRGVPRDVTVTEHEELNVGEGRIHTSLTRAGISGLVNHGKIHALNRESRHLGKT